ncbi:unnamed protein product [Didymodactylos carnosus]|uniref:MULE transposase domain-containing protein n=1 Tax=Didymodactylos carnosus TaxID=1234261 RepID=A0A8S2LZF8_9BILA|nr:unnamed protein product [Didymodactylos carnosus]CAF3925760.1 unnamed protein product [Didymodactylos carnosus]
MKTRTGIVKIVQPAMIFETTYPGRTSIGQEIVSFGTSSWRLTLNNEDFLVIDNSSLAQVYSIHALSPILKGTIPALYTLLPDKNKSTYVSLFNEVRNVTVRNNLLLNPKFITLDFERGAINALKLVFPNSIIKECNFHFNHCLFKKLQELGFQKAFYEAQDNDLITVKSLYQRVAALAFMPLDKIDELWCNIMDDYSDIPNIVLFFDYITEIWIDNSEAMFEKQLWNYYNFDGARTTNSVEGWHHRLNSQVAVTNPNFYFFVKKLRSDYAYNVATIKQVQRQQTTATKEDICE